MVLFAFVSFLISPAYIVFSVLALVWLIGAGRRSSSRRALASPMAILLGLQALFLALSTAFSRDPRVSVRHLAGVSLLLLLPMAIDLMDRPTRARGVLLALGANSVVLALIGVWQFAHGGDSLEQRITATLSHYMTFSGLTMLAGCVLLGFAFEERGLWRWIGIASILPLTAMLLTFTRNAYVGTLFAVVLYLALRRPRGLLLVPPALILIFFLSPHPIRARILSTASLQDVTNRDRISMLHAGARMFADHPFFGIGPEMVKVYYPVYRDADAAQWRVPHLHNNVLQLAAANGVFEALAYLAMMALFFAQTIRLLRRETRRLPAALLAGALMAGAALFVAGFFEYNWGDTEVEMATLLVLAVPFSGACRPEKPTCTITI